MKNSGFVAWGLALALAGPAGAEGVDIRGVWQTEEADGLVEITDCEHRADELCGRLVWVEEPLDPGGRLDLDDENPDPKLQDRPILGLQILEGFKTEPGPEGVFEDGTIYDPQSGKTYSCKMTPRGPDVLDIRGFLGISLLGRTTQWKRVDAPGRR